MPEARAPGNVVELAPAGRAGNDGTMMGRFVPAELARSARKMARRALEAAGVMEAAPPDLDPEFLAAYASCRMATMTSVERMYSLWSAVRHVTAAELPGAVVECGVWRGGSMRLVAETLGQLGAPARDLWLYDTFAGMTAPTSEDRDLRGRPADETWQKAQGEDDNAWCNASLEEVRATMLRPLVATGRSYPEERMHFVRGPVEETLPATLPDGPIAILRLDTDFYASTAHELTHLYPRLLPGGVLIIDDYGHWQGARQAVDEYFSAHPPRPWLVRVDYTGRAAIKP